MPASRGSSLPYPPSELMNYTGQLLSPDERGQYDLIGDHVRDLICSLLPPGWSFEGKRVLDFGCGAGRVIRQFAREAESAEFFGCDIDESCISWARTHLSPPFDFFENAELPPLDRPDASFDLVYGISVFTHLTDTWSEWLLELHRVLRHGGLLILSFLGEGLIEEVTGQPFDERLTGKNDIAIGNPWSGGGPSVLNSPWWLRAHWGRAFEVLDLMPYSNMEARWGPGLVCLRKDARNPPSPADLQKPEEGEPRELSSMRHNAKQLRAELRHLEREATLQREGRQPGRDLGLRVKLRLRQGTIPRDLDALPNYLSSLKARISDIRRERSRVAGSDHRQEAGHPG
jgi:SAM-dependent methyltransferase